MLKVEIHTKGEHISAQEELEFSEAAVVKNVNMSSHEGFSQAATQLLNDML